MQDNTHVALICIRTRRDIIQMFQGVLATAPPRKKSACSIKKSKIKKHVKKNVKNKKYVVYKKTIFRHKNIEMFENLRSIVGSKNQKYSNFE